MLLIQMAGKKICRLFFFSLILLGACGCITSHIAANRIVQAPNRHDSLGLKQQAAYFWKLTNNPLTTFTIPVADVRLAAMELSPADYGTKITVTTNKFPGAKASNNFEFGVAALNKGGVVKLNLWTANSRGTIVLLHGYMLNKETMVPWAFLLAEAGYRVIALDLRGHGQSTGDTVTFGKYETADLGRALDQLVAEKRCDGKIGVLGFSYGATLALHWAARDSRVQAVVALAPYDDLEAAFERVAHELKLPISHGSAVKAMSLAAARLNLDWSDWSGEAAIRQVHAPVLLIGGAKDTISRPDDIATLQKTAAGECKSVQISIADHMGMALPLPEIQAQAKAWFDTHLVPVSLAGHKTKTGQDEQD